MAPMGKFGAVTFNMLAPCYKRLVERTSGNPVGRRRREADSDWKPRAMKAVDFLEKELLTRYHIISLQELWLDENYVDMFKSLINRLGFKLYSFRRHPTRKEDAVAMIVRTSVLKVKNTLKVQLCEVNNRVALILWMVHSESGRNIIVANTHLSFPHNTLDRANQVNQMNTLLEAMDDFAQKKCGCPDATRIIMGDFNVESESAVCDHLREVGYYSALEISPPKLLGTSRSSKINEISESSRNSNRTTNSNKSGGDFILNSASSIVTHRTHRNEDLGVDHIFFKPEIESSDDIDIGGVFATDTVVLPNGSPCTVWDELFTVSDHRPVGSSFIFGQSKKKK